MKVLVECILGPCTLAPVNMDYPTIEFNKGDTKEWATEHEWKAYKLGVQGLSDLGSLKCTILDDSVVDHVSVDPMGHKEKLAEAPKAEAPKVVAPKVEDKTDSDSRILKKK